jgi:hypothetical protein
MRQQKHELHTENALIFDPTDETKDPIKLATIPVVIENWWMDSQDKTNAGTEAVVQWCSENGYAYDDLYWWWEEEVDD